MLIPIIRNLKNKFTIARVHYSLDSEKATPEWKERTKQGMPESGWLREYEIDYATFVGKAIFPEFKYELNVRSLKVEGRQILYVGWDFGFHYPAVLVTMLDQFDRWCWVKGILGHDEGIEKFGKRIKEFLLSEYSGCKFLHAADPAGHQKTDKAEKTSIQVLEALGIFPQTVSTPINEGIEIIRQKLGMRDDGKVGLLINDTEEDLIEGFKGGYRYPEVKEGEAEQEKPLDDGYYIHLFDAARYVAVNFFSLIEYGKKEPNPITHEDQTSTQVGLGHNIIPEGQGMADLF